MHLLIFVNFVLQLHSWVEDSWVEEVSNCVGFYHFNDIPVQFRPSTETYRYTEDEVLKIKSLWKKLKVLVLVLTPPPISACTWLIYCSGFLRHNGGHMIKCLWNEVVAVSEATITAGILQSSHACAASLLLLFPINSTSIEIVSAPRCHTTKNDLRIEKKQV